MIDSFLFLKWIKGCWFSFTLGCTLAQLSTMGNCSLVVLNTGFILLPSLDQLVETAVLLYWIQDLYWSQFLFSWQDVCEREKWAKLNPDWGWLEHYKSSLSSASQAWRLQQWTVRMSLKHPHTCGSCTGFFFLFFVCGSCTVRATILNCWNSSPSAIYETELLHSGISFSQLLTYSIHH